MEAITTWIAYKHGQCDILIDITDPTNPTEVGYYDTGDNNTSYGISLSQDGTKAFVTDCKHGLVIIDLELFTPISNKPSANQLIFK